ncbi:hypothetical protein GCM10007103_19690 [Salinimicrobium marinum]|uniref:GmrSD restriction endonucleases N-terminal domain-containing protein n=2 Tax=Salinimicrobium marinum TaxID=680283 RepID=A0A918SGP9_9FLAO|nr:hypothetical protein GCM10007103_19690 [Salinimicrobium marinum]
MEQLWNDHAIKTKDDIEITNEENVSIEVPFDPNLIKIRNHPFTLGALIDRIEHNELNFQTAFQRKEGLWTITQMSRLMESIFLKLPLPAFYFDEKNENYWEVIDGLQRCSVIKEFVIKKSITLTNLEFLHQFEGLAYDELPRDIHRRIKTTPLTIYVIERGTPKEVKFNIFKRINTQGLILTPQEIRHALNQGKPADTVASLANLSEFKKATCNKIKAMRMEDRDFTTRFVSFYLIPSEKYQPDLDSFMTKGMAEIDKLDSEGIKNLKNSFKKSMNLAWEIFKEDAFRKRFHENDRRKPLNKAIFEAISVSFAKLSIEQREKLRSKAGIFRTKFIELNNSDRFYKAISSGTGQKENVNIRFKEIQRIINETLE